MKNDVLFNLTGHSSKVFKVAKKDNKNLQDEIGRARCIIDPLSAEFDMGTTHSYDLGKQTELAWCKMLLLLSAFERKEGLDKFKRTVADTIDINLPHYSDFEDKAKLSLASFIVLLRTGEYEIFAHPRAIELADNMTVDALIDLLHDELDFRATGYSNKNSKFVFIEIEELHYDYDDLISKYNSDDYLKYITTSKHTELLKNQQEMFAQMRGE